ncbi:hypothetical protein KIPB_007552 [Kipferlia bialata]|uniref:Uncharacterized protein n=1 Tax=Kipferlia bialata TaxID=797122 RepID=A0A391NML4_9EUKA|nr:hypothetical protein KIPB_007552 [Kipferlia bialata]|eukprot:g7552.t1
MTVSLTYSLASGGPVLGSSFHGGMAYIGPLIDKGEIDADKVAEDGKAEFLIVRASSSDYCMIGTCHTETKTVTTQPISCPIPTDAGGITATRVGESVYVFGGYSPAYNHLFCYDITSKQWRQVQQSGQWPSARGYHAAFELGGNLYVVGGYSFRDSWKFSPSSGTWQKLGDAPVLVHFTDSCVVGDTAHVIGCHANKNQHLTFTASGGWRTESPLPFQVDGAGVVSMGTSLVVMCGRDHSGQVHVYDTDQKTWTKESELPIKGGDNTQCACLVTPYHCGDAQ